MTRLLSRLLASPLSLFALFFPGVEPDTASSGDNGSILDPDG